MHQSYAHGVASRPLLGQTLGQALDTAACRFGARDAVISLHQNLRYSYAELLHEVNRAAKALIALGVQRGDRVGIWSPNNAEWTITQYAAAKAGAILVNVNPAYRLRELQYALKQSGVSVLISARSFRSADYVQMLDELAPALPALRHVVFLGDSDPPGGVTWADFLRRGDGVSDVELARREALLQFDDPVNIQYTSGTTGSPKGATLSHHNILNNGYFVGEAACTTPKTIGSAFRCPSITASAACSATWRRSRTAARSSFPANRSIRKPRCGRFDASGARRSTACRRCSSRSWTIAAFEQRSVSTRCARASWRARRARSMSCGSVIDRMHVPRGHDLLRHDRNVAGVVSVGHRRSD